MATTAMQLQRVMQDSYWPTLRRVIIAAIAYDVDNPSDLTKWSMPTFSKTPGAITGAAVVETLIAMRPEVLILQHWGNLGFVQQLRRHLPTTKLLFWVSVEAVRSIAEPHFSDLEFQLRSFLHEHLLRGTDGGYVDIYFGNPKGPAWAVDMLDDTIPDGVAKLTGQAQLETGVDGFFIDSMMRFSFFATAPNKPPPQDRANAFTVLVRAVRNWAPHGSVIVWGNTVTEVLGYEPALDVMFCEQFFYGHEFPEEAEQHLKSSLCLVPQRSTWAASPARWRYIAHMLALTGLSNVFVCTGWTGQHRFEPIWRF